MFYWLLDNFGSFKSGLEKVIERRPVDHLYMDMNAVIHVATHGNISPVVQMANEQRLRRITSAIEMMFDIVRPRKMLYMAVDGVCPTAKINQQRGRRFLTSKNVDPLADICSAVSAEDGYTYIAKRLPFDEYDNVSFNPNYISPGTDFMKIVDSEISNWLALKTEEGFFGKCMVTYNGVTVPGEGEHKIFQCIRKMNKVCKRSRKDVHLVYGLDADLMMLSMAVKMPNIKVLREERNYAPHVVSKKKGEPYFSTDTGIVHLHKWDFIDLKKTHFEVASLHSLRKRMYERCWGYIMRKYGPSSSSFLNRPEAPYRITDDFVLLSFLAGNDFLPRLPTVDLANDSFKQMLVTYYGLMHKWQGFLTDGSKIHVPRLQTLFKSLAKHEMEWFKEKGIIEGVPEYSDRKLYADYYHENKCQVDSKANVKKMCIDYIKGLFWILIYYHHDCPSWDWKLSASTGELRQYFPTEFEINEDGRIHEWEHVVKLPFVNTQKLVKAAQKANPGLKYSSLYK
eukprot:XP_001610853.1 5'-3' exonuclease [Babesia bovis T2Bo]